MTELDDVFGELRALLTRHESSLTTLCDEPGDLQLAGKRAGPSGTAMPFASVTTNEADVSLQFMPVYSHADLLDEVSEPLRERMEGRSCLRFTPDAMSPQVLEELSALIEAGLARYRADGLV